MRMFFLFAFVVLVALASGAEPSAEKPTIIRPVIWWAGVNAFSDGGGGGVKESTHCFTSSEAWAKQWSLLKIPGDPPQVDFENYVVVLTQRYNGLSFEPNGGLVVGDNGEARLSGRQHTNVIMNAGYWSSTIAIFPREGIQSIDGVKLPAEQTLLRRFRDGELPK